MEKEIDTLSHAIKQYGAPAQTIKAIEEMSELQKELCKHLAGKNNVSEIAEEIADVEIMLTQMTLIFGCAFEVIEWKKKKIDRLANRLRKESDHEAENRKRQSAVSGGRRERRGGLLAD